MKAAGREVRVLHQLQPGAVFEAWSAEALSKKSIPEILQELQRCKGETQVGEIVLYGEDLRFPKYVVAEESLETIYAADGSVSSVQPVWDRVPEERHDYSHDGVQLQLQQLALGTSGETAEDVKEMEMLKKMAETMTPDDMSTHLWRRPAKYLPCYRRTQTMKWD